MGNEKTKAFDWGYDDFLGLSTKHPPNLIPKSFATRSYNTLFDETGSMSRRNGTLRIKGPVAATGNGLVINWHIHKDQKGYEYLIVAMEETDAVRFYFTTDTLSDGATWTKLTNAGSDLVYTLGYYPTFCSFQTKVYIQNGFNGVVEFEGSAAVTVPDLPKCRFMVSAHRRLWLINLLTDPLGVRPSAFDEPRFTGNENSENMFYKASTTNLPDVGLYYYRIPAQKEVIEGAAYYKGIIVFGCSQSLWMGHGGMDPSGSVFMEERMKIYRLSSVIGLGTGRTFSETPFGDLIFRGSDGQLYKWVGSIQGAENSEQFGATILPVSDPPDLQRPNISDLMDGYKKPNFAINIVGPDIQSDWVAGTTKVNIDTTARPGSIVASKDASGLVVKESYLPIIDTWYPFRYYNYTGKMGTRFLCTEAGPRKGVSFRVKAAPEPIMGQAIMETDLNGLPSGTIVASSANFYFTGTDVEQEILIPFTYWTDLVLNQYYHIYFYLFYPLKVAHVNLGCKRDGAYNDGNVVLHITDRGWMADYVFDVWFKLWGNTPIYQSSSTWHHYYDKGNITDRWGLFTVDSIVLPETSLLYYLKCAADAADVDTAEEIIEPIVNGECIEQAKFGGEAANHFVGIKVVGGTTTPQTNTWEVKAMKASYRSGSVNSLYSCAEVWKQKYHLSLQEADKSQNNLLLIMDKFGGFHIHKGFTAAGADQPDYGFNCLGIYKDAFIGALSKVLTGMITQVASAPFAGGTGYTQGDILTITTGGTGGRVTASTVVDGVVTGVTALSEGKDYTIGSEKETSGGTGTGCTINITAVDAAIYHLAKLDQDQEFDLVNDLDHKILLNWKSRIEECDLPFEPKDFIGAAIIRKELGASKPFKMFYAIDGGTQYALGYRQNEGVGTIQYFGASLAVGGTGFAVGDVVSVDGGTELAYLAVTSVEGGVITSFVMLNGGKGYSVANGVATTIVRGAGTGLTVNITSVIEDMFLYPESYTDGKINQKWYSDSPQWPRDRNLVVITQDIIAFPNLNILEPVLSAQRTHGNRIQYEIKTTDKIQIQKIITRLRLLLMNRRTAGGLTSGRSVGPIEPTMS